ncbi:adhesive plaque matrix protein [Phthorimaea operculella]|nr:adhesive plaque matrix protein [Phthorimaea operculella]
MSPWGYECREKLLKQNKVKPTEKRPTKWDGFVPPGPAHYEKIPEIFCGPGFSHIKRAPAYSFGINTPIIYKKPATKPNAPQFNIRGMTRKGIATTPQGTIAEKCELPSWRSKTPGPGAYTLKDDAYLKNAPAYSIRMKAKPPYEPWDQWTCPPNMYNPAMVNIKKPPAYSFGDRYKRKDDNKLPGPGDFDPKHDRIQKKIPEYSFGRRLKTLAQALDRNAGPAPNMYCEKRLMYGKKSSPAPSFGIRHSPYLGKFTAYEIPSRLEMLARDLV